MASAFGVLCKEMSTTVENEMLKINRSAAVLGVYCMLGTMCNSHNIPYYHNFTKKKPETQSC